jgi:catechol 2,3-dioxygenase-like lactoylglutathione lyase family enzyme
VEVRRLGWLGMRTERFDEMVRLFRDVMHLPVGIEQPGRTMFALPNGDPIDVFHTSLEQYEWFPDAPVVGFVVDDVEAGARELEAAGIEVNPVQHGDGFMWAHFRGPDGNLYELQSTDPPS